jgi:hypothetical protein
MSRRQFWRWLLLGDEDWPWVSRLNLWQYLLVDWAIAVLAGLVAFAIAAAILRHFPLSGGSSPGSAQSAWSAPPLHAADGGASRHKCLPHAPAPRTDLTAGDQDWVWAEARNTADLRRYLLNSGQDSARAYLDVPRCLSVGRPLGPQQA